MRMYDVFDVVRASLSFGWLGTEEEHRARRTNTLNWLEFNALRQERGRAERRKTKILNPITIIINLMRLDRDIFCCDLREGLDLEGEIDVFRALVN